MERRHMTSDLPTTSPLELELSVIREVDAALAGFSPSARIRIIRKTGQRLGFTTPPPPPDRQRGTAVEAAARLGLKPRKLQAMSQRGEIPGAAKLGRQWTYDLAKLRRFIEQQEKVTTCRQGAKPRRAATGAALPSGAALRPAGDSSAGRLRRMIQQSQRRVAKQARSG
jgi:hypothetical protein